MNQAYCKITEIGPIGPMEPGKPKIAYDGGKVFELYGIDQQGSLEAIRDADQAAEEIDAMFLRGWKLHTVYLDQNGHEIMHLTKEITDE